MYIESNNKAIYKYNARNNYRACEHDAIRESKISYDRKKNQFMPENHFTAILNLEIADKKVSVKKVTDKNFNVYEKMFINEKPFIETRNKKLISLTLHYTTSLEKIDNPQYESLLWNLESFCAYKLKSFPQGFDPHGLRTLYLPACQTFERFALNRWPYLQNIYAPNLEIICGDNLFKNKYLTEFVAPKLGYIGNWVLSNNEIIEHLDIKNVRHIGNGFLKNNRKLKRLYTPDNKFIGMWVLESNQILDRLNISKTEHIGHNFLHNNLELTEFVAPKLLKAPVGILHHNNKLQKIHLDSCETIAKSAFANKPDKTHIYAPYLPKEYLTITDSLNTLFIQESMNKKIH